MIESLHIADRLEAQMIRGRRLSEQLALKGRYDIEQLRGGIVIAKRTIPNGITNTGKDNLLNRFFNLTGTSSSLWYFGLIDGAVTPTLNAADTMASHAGWTEYVNYSSTPRLLWDADAASGQAISNSVAAVFTFTVSTGTAYGIFLTTDSTKTGNTGTLWSTAGFNAPLPVEVDDVLNVTYTLQL